MVESTASSHLLRLRQRLRAALAASRPFEDSVSRSPAAAVSRALGHHPSYMHRVLEGELPLRVVVTCDLLKRLDLDPRDFFLECFPLGGDAEVRLRAALAERQASDPLLAAGSRVRSASATPVRTQDVLPPVVPEVIVARAGLLLRWMIRRSPHTQGDLSERLGFGSRHVLGQALRGESELKFEQVFPVLTAIGVTPGRYFRELLSPLTHEVVEGITWSDLLDRLEHAAREAAEGYLRQLERGEAPSRC